MGVLWLKSTLLLVDAYHMTTLHSLEVFSHDQRWALFVTPKANSKKMTSNPHLFSSLSTLKVILFLFYSCDLSSMSICVIVIVREELERTGRPHLCCVKEIGTEKRTRNSWSIMIQQYLIPSRETRRQRSIV